ARRLHAREAGDGEPVDELGPPRRLQHLGLVLEAVARADVAEREQRYSSPYESMCSGRMRTLRRVSSGLRHGYSSSPRYFFASLSICASAPSVVNSAVPLIASQRYWSCGSTASHERRGSRLRCLGLARPSAVLKPGPLSSTSTHTRVVWGEPSSRSVVSAPADGWSRNSARGG